MRKTRYLVSLGRRIERLPKIREALVNGTIGWCRASRIANVATPENEAMWLDSASSLTVTQLERRIKDGTDTLVSMLHLPLTEERRVLWENALEIYRRRAGAEISPVQAFEYMLAEIVAEWGYVVDTDDEPESESEEQETVVTEMEPAEAIDDASQPVGAPREQSVFPWTATTDTESLLEKTAWESEAAAEQDFWTSPSYGAVRQQVLERDGWRCRYPGCAARADLHVHHVRFRSRGGSDAPGNLIVVCNFHHDWIHTGRVRLEGRAPTALEWTPPKLMQEVLERRRNNPSIRVGELDVSEWSVKSRTPDWVAAG